ncbi:MAG: hypothetical protein WC817_02605 [Patescibacteria group bacterium]|jgi:transcriptional regulator of heat shock response
MSQKLSERQAAILGCLIRAHIETAAPVGSLTIVERTRIGASSATIRNEMANLEQMGYLRSPHTSAGRIPTEQGYRYYLEYLVTPALMPDIEERRMRSIQRSYEDFEERFRQLAKAVAEFSAEGVFLAFGKNNLYYTGLSNLFAQPEFREQRQLVAMGQVIDHLDEAVSEIFASESGNDVTVLVGSDNPFGRDCSVILLRYGSSGSNTEKGLFGILGPTRMDYDRNITRVTRVRDCVKLE